MQRSNTRESIAGISLAAAVIVATTIVPAALGDVRNYGGNIFAGVETSPPSNNDLRLGRTEDNTRAHVYREGYHVPLQLGTVYDAEANGRYDQNSDLRQGVVPFVGNGRVNSYLIHFDPTSGARNRSARGWIDFDQKIYVLSRNQSLDNTDNDYGFASVRYPGFLADRGMDLNPQDWFDISTPSPGIWRLEFFVEARTGLDQMRVIELVPAPSSLALLGAGGLIAVRRRRAR